MNKLRSPSKVTPEVAPTMRTAAWTLTDFLDAAISLCDSEKDSHQLRLYFYAATNSGWRQLRKSILKWHKAKNGRSITAYIGTDHALTDADLLTEMQSDGIEVRLMRHYTGTFHPKVIWFLGKKSSKILAGSNNLTEDGLKNNIEFSTVTEIAQVDGNLLQWHDEIHKSSELATSLLVESYANEKQKYGSERAKSGQSGTFTWSKRTSGTPTKKPRLDARRQQAAASLILEVMPRETSLEGRQVQIPLIAARNFFGLGDQAGSSVKITLRNITTKESRTLAFTLNSNATARLSIRELEYSSRPCVLIFTKKGERKFDFELVRRAIDPSRFDRLISECRQKPPARRWKL